MEVPKLTNNIERDRAAFAYWLFKKNCANDKKKQEEFLRTAEKLPVLLRQNGIGATIAFLQAKKIKKGEMHFSASTFLEGIYTWISKQRKLAELQEHNIMKSVIDLDQDQYINMYLEVFALSDWFKRIAKAEYAA